MNAPARLIVACLVAGVAATTHAGEIRAGHSSFPLTSSLLTQSDTGRELLGYLVSCALPEGVEVTVTSPAGDRSVFAGSLGLAPSWQERALTRDEQERVSACILARTNAFGVKVRISIRAMDPRDADVETLRADMRERQQFPVFEGGFFGNIFAPEPVAYVCSGSAAPARLRALRRVCSLPVAPGSSVTRCGFRLIGACTGDASVAAKAAPGHGIAVYLADK